MWFFVEGAADQGTEQGGLDAPGGEVLPGEVAGLVDRAGDDQRLAAKGAQRGPDDRAGCMGGTGSLPKSMPSAASAPSVRTGPGARVSTSTPAGFSSWFRAWPSEAV